MMDNSQERAVSLKASISAASKIELEVKKLHTAVVGSALAKSSRQLAVLNAVRKRINEVHAGAPNELRSSLKMLTNEVISLREGVQAGLVSAEDMYLQSTKDVLLSAKRLQASASKQLTAIGYGSTDHGEDWARVIQRNSKFKADIAKTEASVQKQGFGFARVPVSLSFVRNMRNKHSSVGFLSLELLDDLGFKADMIGGYAVIYGQVVIGVDPTEAFVVTEDVDPETGKVTKKMTPKFVKEKVIKFTKDVGGFADKKRQVTSLDLAKQFKKLLEAKTNVKYSFVSEKPHGHKGTSYFWLMPDRDLARFAKAFPGKHVGMDAWGFAF